MAKQKNDNTDNEFGNDYRTLVALNHCFDLKKGEKIVFEKWGDVSLIKNDKKIQIEVKHHIDSNSLGDGNGELWKSLYNWVSNDISQFDELILHTTSHLPQKSSLAVWHGINTTSDVRHFILKESCKSDAVDFKKYHSLIFNDKSFSEEHRKNVFGKVKLDVKQPNFEELLNEIKDKVVFSWIKEDGHKKNIIYKVLGEITGLKKVGIDWELTREGFDSIMQNIRYIYDTAPSVLILDQQFSANPKKGEIQSFQLKKFVKAIAEVECDEEEIEEAIVDYWRFNSAYFGFMQTYPSFHQNTFKHYKNEIIHRDLKNIRRTIKDDNSGQPVKIVSKKFFRKAIELQLKEHNLLQPNRDYFQRGTMHDLVEDGEIKWLIE